MSYPHSQYIDLDGFAPASKSQRWANVLLPSCLACLGLACIALAAHANANVAASALPSTMPQVAQPALHSVVGRHSTVVMAMPSQMSMTADLLQGTAAQSEGIGQWSVRPSETISSYLTMLPLFAIGSAALLVWRFLRPSAQSPSIAMAAVTCAEIDQQFPPLQNDNALRAIRGEAVDRIPVWVMRQAGRYLPEYVEYTKDKEFFSRCQSPEVACHLTLQPFDRYDLDAGIIFSDILVIPQALGMEVKMIKGQGPVFTTPLRQPEQWYQVERDILARLGVTDIPEAEQDQELIRRAPEVVKALNYVYEAITLTRTKLNGRAPLIGFCGSPWTLFVYVSEAKKTKTYTECSKLIYGQPEFVHRVLTVLAHVCAQYLIRQVKAGAQMLQVFDSHASVLPPKQWAQFSLPYLNKIAELVKEECPDIPMIVLPKDASFALDMLTDSPYDMVSLDPSLDLGKSHQQMLAVGKGVQGNMACTTMYAPPEKVKELASEYLVEAFGEGAPLPTRYIANLGSGMNPDMDPACLGAFVEAIHSFGSK